uniref:Protein kinase domain-containing protein n=1 Tax=Ditylenchus dipsaci TaxID=166011 RepID=A0A915DMD8_9BILA
MCNSDTIVRCNALESGAIIWTPVIEGDFRSDQNPGSFFNHLVVAYGCFLSHAKDGTAQPNNEDDGQETEQTEEETEKGVPGTNDYFRSELTGIRYKLDSVISEGGFGIVYEASYAKGNLSQKAAMKIEKWDKSMQANEVVVLQAAQRTSCQHFRSYWTMGHSQLASTSWL